MRSRQDKPANQWASLPCRTWSEAVSSTDNQLIDKPFRFPYSFIHALQNFGYSWYFVTPKFKSTSSLQCCLYNVTGTLQLAWAGVRWASLLKIFQVDRSQSFSSFITLNMFSCMHVIAILMDTLHLQWLCFACRFVCQQTVFTRRFSELNRTTPVIVTYFVRSGIWVFPNVRSGEVGTLNTPYTCLRLVLVFRCMRTGNFNPEVWLIAYMRFRI